MDLITIPSHYGPIHFCSGACRDSFVEEISEQYSDHRREWTAAENPGKCGYCSQRVAESKSDRYERLYKITLLVHCPTEVAMGQSRFILQPDVGPIPGAFLYLMKFSKEDGIAKAKVFARLTPYQAKRLAMALISHAKSVEDGRRHPNTRVRSRQGGGVTTEINISSVNDAIWVSMCQTSAIPPNIGEEYLHALPSVEEAKRLAIGLLYVIAEAEQ